MIEFLRWVETIEGSKENESKGSSPVCTVLLLVLRIKTTVFWI